MRQCSLLKQLLFLLCLTSPSSLSWADSIEKYPDWNLSAEDHDDPKKIKFFLEPPDGRPTVAVTQSAAARLMAGTLNPEDVYRDHLKELADREKEAKKSSAESSTGITGGSGGAFANDVPHPNSSTAENWTPTRSQSNTGAAPVAASAANQSPTSGSVDTTGASGNAGETSGTAIEQDNQKTKNLNIKTLTIVPERPQPKAQPGCHYYRVPKDAHKLKVTVVGGGGGGSRSTPSCAYHHLSGAGGAAVIALVNVSPGQDIEYCPGAGGKAATGTGYYKGHCGDTQGRNGGTSSFGPFIVAEGGEGGNAWHYKGKDHRGHPPSAGGNFKTSGAVTVLKAEKGASVTELAACGGDAGLDLGKGSCASGKNGTDFGGGGYGGGRQYSLGPEATNGGKGTVKIEVYKAK